jgi:hypothetical protein
MRWFVEVSTIGDSAAPARLCVDAAQWQSAFEEARRLLKDAGPLSKFSIEVLDDGYRAVNPAQRSRYVIRRAPEDAVLTDESSVRPSSIPPPEERRARAVASLVGTERATSSVTVPSDTVPPAPPAPSQQQPVARASTPEQPSEIAPMVTLPGPVSTEDSRPLRRRSEEASAESPLLYREVAYVVVPGLSRDAVERVLLQRFREVCAELEGKPVRKYVQLAIFDHEFDERPWSPPLATLTWKDWRGVPTIGFPAFGEAAPPPSSLPPRVPDWAASPSEPPSAPLQSRPGSSIPPSSDAVGVIPSVPIGPPGVPRPPASPKVESGSEDG